MKFIKYYFVLSSLLILHACGDSKTMSLKEWENDSHFEKVLFSGEEVDEIVVEILNAEEKNLPYQAPADKDWELLHTDLEINLNFKEKNLEGNALISLKPYFYPQRNVRIDAKGMDIFSVEIAQQNGMKNGPKPDPLKWNYNDSLHLDIEFPYIIAPNETVRLSIAYRANPERKISKLDNVSHTAVNDDKGVYFVNTDGKNPTYHGQVWTQGEPESNSRWFPTLDKPNQKHTQKIAIEFPDSLISISNGILKESRALKNGRKRDIWEMQQKHAVYLSMFAVGSWKEVYDTTLKVINQFTDTTEIPIRYFVEPGYANYAKEIFGNTPEMIHFFEGITGVAYPWNKYDQIVCREFVSGAMENTTAVIHNDRLQDPSNKMEDYIAHELFHHWFGDYTTAESWGHLSMNESFATYSEYLWREYKYGKINAEEWLLDNTTYPQMGSDGFATGFLKSTPLMNPHYKNANDQFDDIRYNKGAQVLHELRNLIGGDAFNASMKCYLTENAFKNGNVYDWKKCVEVTTGKNMDHFFNSWYFQGGEFSLLYETEKDSATNTKKLILQPGIAENDRITAHLRNYGCTKTQQVYIHVLGKNHQTWDTNILILPYQKSLEYKMPFEDSLIVISYTNPQNYNYTQNTELIRKANINNVSLFSDYLNIANYVNHNNRFHYFQKVNALLRAFRELNTLGLKSELAYLVTQMAISSLNIDTETNLDRPLLSNLNFEMVMEYYNEHTIKNTYNLQLLQNYHDSILAVFTKETRMEYQVYYYNFLSQLENRFQLTKATEQKEIAEPITSSWIHGNATAVLEGALMKTFFAKSDITSTLIDILNSDKNSMPVKAKFTTSLWGEQFDPVVDFDIKQVLIPIIADQKWSTDLTLKWLNAAFSRIAREESMLLDIWIQQLKNHTHLVPVTQYYFTDQWEILKSKKADNFNNDVGDQLRYSLLEGLFSINLK